MSFIVIWLQFFLYSLGVFLAQRSRVVGKSLTGRPAAHALARYRCFLPDLAGLAGLRRAGPGVPILTSLSGTGYVGSRAAGFGFHPEGNSGKINKCPRGPSILRRQKVCRAALSGFSNGRSTCCWWWDLPRSWAPTSSTYPRLR